MVHVSQAFFTLPLRDHDLQVSRRWFFWGKKDSYSKIAWWNMGSFRLKKTIGRVLWLLAEVKFICFFSIAYDANIWLMIMLKKLLYQANVFSGIRDFRSFFGGKPPTIWIPSRFSWVFPIGISGRASFETCHLETGNSPPKMRKMGLEDFYLYNSFPDAQWGWPIYLQNWVVLGVNVGKYTSPIEHLGLWI